MPEHTHGIKQGGNSVTVDHTHNVLDPGHGHAIDAVGRKGTRSRGFIPVPVNYNKHHDGPYYLRPTTSQIIVKPPENTSIKYSFPSELIDYTGGVGQNGLSPNQKKVKSFDNRPPFVIVAYIVKLAY